MPRQTKYISRSKRNVKKVSNMPSFLLKGKGLIDSFKGEGVCDKNIDRWYKKLAYQAGSEDIAAENDLFLLRKEAGAIVLQYKEKKKKMEEVVSSVPLSNDNIRESRNSAVTIRTGRSALQEIDETIAYIETIRNIRIDKMHSSAEEKIAAYVSGIRWGKLKNYTPPENKRYDDSARLIYREKHEALEQQMHMILAEEV